MSSRVRSVPPARPRPSRHCLTAVLAALFVVAAGSIVTMQRVAAQDAGTAIENPLAKRLQGNAADGQMLVSATELIYDNDKQTVSAVGQVQIYYSGNVLEADKVIYDQQASRLYAEGNVKLTQPDGNIVYSDRLNLSDDFRDGFADALRVQAPDETRFAAARATRSEGNITVFDSGVYTACKPCAEAPEKPPFWQVKAARIIHNQQEKMIYFEQARLEFFGVPIAYVPFLSAPDPTVKRKTGFLPPKFYGNEELGYGVEVPLFIVLAPNMDITLAPAILSNQGLLMKGEFRHRLVDGSYAIRAAGISQADPDAFPDKPYGAGGIENRGMIQTSGQFNINEHWNWGWDLWFISDKFFPSDYKTWGEDDNEAISTIYLTGLGDRSFFDLRGYHFEGLTNLDVQETLPFVAPVLDYQKVLDQTVFGGEVSFKVNSTTLTRDEPDFVTNTLDVPIGVRGVAGDYTRVSAEGQWQRQIIDPVGQVWTPFAFIRGDLIWSNLDDDPVMNSFLTDDDDTVFRGMAGIGLEYRYPFVAHTEGATHVLEPIAQLLLRPNETHVGELPNEDAQSLFFDDTNLFSWNKFSGWDRIEGGSRLNAGLQYTVSLDNGASAVLLFGESFQLFGENSFATSDLAGVGPYSGLETDRSDYVGSLTVSPFMGTSVVARARFDEEDFDANTLEFQGTTTFGAITASVVYGRYDANPPAGFDEVREGVGGSAKLQLDKNWYAIGSALYNLETDGFTSSTAGIGYLNECFDFQVALSTDWSDNGNADPVHTVMFRLALRTLGEGKFSSEVDLGGSTGTP